MSALLNKTYIMAAMLGCLSLAAAPVAAEAEATFPATEHQAETMKRTGNEAEEAFTSSKKKAAGTMEELNDGKQMPATEHQEEVVQGVS